MTPMPDHIASTLQAYEDLMAEVRDIVRKEISTTEALLLAFIGNRSMFVSDIRPTGCYFGTNVSHTLRLLESGEFIKLESDKRDRRRKILSLTPKGLSLAERIRQGLAKRERVAA
jgi:DNA-binding MarR family transcriptional regulator